MESEIKHLTQRIESLESKFDTLEERLTKYFEAQSLQTARIIEMQGLLTSNSETHRNIHQRLDAQAQDTGRIFGKFEDVYSHIGAINSRISIVETTTSHCKEEILSMNSRVWAGILLAVGSAISALVMHLMGK